MRRTALLLLPALLLAGCGSPSTLSADDQELCSEQADKLAYGREAVKQIIEGDRHWADTSEAFAYSEVGLTPAYNYLTSREPQDAELTRLADEGAKAMLNVRLYMPDDVFADDAKVARDAAALLDELGEFCEANG